MIMTAPMSAKVVANNSGLKVGTLTLLSEAAVNAGDWMHHTREQLPTQQILLELTNLISRPCVDRV
jgi:hypothetical protein